MGDESHEPSAMDAVTGAAAMKACPFCAEVIKAEAVKCRFCRTDLTRAPPSAEPHAPSAPPPGAIVVAAPTASSSRAGTVSPLALVGGATVVAGAFLPWKSMGMLSRNGVDGGGDGLITALFGLLVLLAGAGPLRGWRWAACVLFALLAAAIGVVDILAVQQQIAELQASDNPFAAGMSVGYGLYATVIGGVLAVLGALTVRK